MKITIHKFKTLQDLTIQVPAQITGGNGTGKTSILEAISFCLTGKGLDGKEMAQIYDNRVDLHDAVADVSFFDSYGNEYRRKVEPVFETKRDGAERLKILRSTKCTKNGIDTNDFASEFQDFYKFGTDYFFAQKETDQRAIFIDLMKSLLPHYDVKKAQEKLKSLEKTQRDTVSEIKNIRSMLKELRNEEIEPIPEDIQMLEDKYQELLQSSADNQAAIAKINEENNNADAAFRQKKYDLQSQLSENERKLEGVEYNIQEAKNNLKELEARTFKAEELIDVSELKKTEAELKSKLEGLTYFDDVQEYGKKYASDNPVVAQNIEKIKALQSGGSDGEDITDVCPACGVASPQALEKALHIKISEIKRENRDLLTIDIREANNEYLKVSDELDRISVNLKRYEALNEKTKSENEARERTFKIDRTNKRELLNSKINELTKQVEPLKNEIVKLENEIKELKEPSLKNLPTELTIPDEVRQGHAQFSELRDKQVGAKAINENNSKIKGAKEIEIREKQNLLSNLDGEVAELKSEISEYFSNLNEVVEKEFEGQIKIGVQLLEYVITKDEYKDCFKITANGKIFPGECNGALQNNVKLQVLSTLQRLKGYTGITIMDNAEANTTQPLNGEGLNLVAARANESNELTIK